MAVDTEQRRESGEAVENGTANGSDRFALFRLPPKSLLNIQESYHGEQAGEHRNMSIYRQIEDNALAPATATYLNCALPFRHRL